MDAELGSIVDGPILHIVVIGFHHKKGCQVDFSYPPLVEGCSSDSPEVPPEWKHLPCHAVPDGAHNYLEDTIYFHLPGKGESRNTVYGISCYRQIDTKDLISKDKEFTRGTVQKSVCVLSKLPLYGLIQAKLKLITHAYFSERDFSKTSILMELYKSLNGSLTTGHLDDSQVFLDLPLRDLVLTFKHKVLVLFKLLLLERRVLFFAQPVHTLSTSLLSLVSLFPAMLEHGLIEAASYKHYRPQTPTLELRDFGIDTKEYENVTMSHVPNYRKKKTEDTNLKTPSGVDKDSPLESPCNNLRKTDDVGSFQSSLESPGTRSGDSTLTRDSAIPDSITSLSSTEMRNSTSSIQQSDPTNVDLTNAEDVKSSSRDRTASQRARSKSGESKDEATTPGSTKSLEEDLLAMIDQELYGPYFEGRKPSQTEEDNVAQTEKKNSTSSSTETEPKQTENDRVFSDPLTRGIQSSLSRDTTPDQKKKKVPSDECCEKETGQGLSGAEDFVVLHNCPSVSTIKADDFGFPLSLFGKGSLCHPYMALQQHDLLQDVNVRCFLIGASNMLFKQRRHLIDVLVEVEDGKVLVFDSELRKELSLSTADLRFADFLIKHVSEKSQDLYLDNTGWEGGDEWIRAQFKVYVLSLLSTGLHQKHERSMSDFNDSFVSAWKTTHNYRIWMSKEHPGIDFIHAGHPFQGQLGMNDMKIRLQSAMQTTDRGKKLNSALNRTSVAMLHTGKAVGGALSSAKSAVSAWISGLASEWKDADDDADYEEDQD
ncbi:late secretory pathway protein AVL9 homolog [Asterias rubens]|uniref:late secretory pathway protein AVL9 homolog n=1 Tax=Asterias rubens TaxID=7604 RepID=UPI001455AE31|nr:late secretory pathway protein AVL9 homolog [Asterias rubens]